MSILTQAQPATEAQPRLLSAPLAVTFVAEFTSLTSFFLLLSVMPMLAAAAGAGSSTAGLMTGSLLLGTVAAEAMAAVAIGRFGSRAVLAAGTVLLGAPALAMLAREPEAVMVAVSLVRGLGFGLCGVVTGTLTAQLLPPDRRGEGLGLLGLVSGVPAILALPAGVWLAGHHQAAVAAAIAAAVGLLPLAVLRWLPGGREPRGSVRAGRGVTDGGHGQDEHGFMPGGSTIESGRTSGGSRQVADGMGTGPVEEVASRPAEDEISDRRVDGAGARVAGGALPLTLIFAAATIAAGVIDSFLPLAKEIPANLASGALLVQSIAATLSRWQAGSRGDRYGHARLLIPALAVAALGLAALLAIGSPVALFAGMALFGTGFGVLENATFALLLDELPEATASAAWNFAYDAGYGAGPAVFGLVCARVGYRAGFGLTGALVLAAIPLAMLGRRQRPSLLTTASQ